MLRKVLQIAQVLHAPCLLGGEPVVLFVHLAHQTVTCSFVLVDAPFLLDFFKTIEFREVSRLDLRASELS